MTLRKHHNQKRDVTPNRGSLRRAPRYLLPTLPISQGEDDWETESDTDCIFSMSREDEDGTSTAATTPDTKPSWPTTPSSKGQQAGLGLSSVDSLVATDSCLSLGHDKVLPVTSQSTNKSQKRGVPRIRRTSPNDPALIFGKRTPTPDGGDAIDKAQNVSTASVSYRDESPTPLSRKSRPGGSAVRPSSASSREPKGWGQDQIPSSSRTKTAHFVFGAKNPGQGEFTFGDVNRDSLSDPADIKPSEEIPKTATATCIKSEPVNDTAKAPYWSPVGVVDPPIREVPVIFGSASQSPKGLIRPERSSGSISNILPHSVSVKSEVIADPPKTKQSTGQVETVTHTNPPLPTITKPLKLEATSGQQPGKDFHTPIVADSTNKEKKGSSFANFVASVMLLRRLPSAVKAVSPEPVPTPISRSLSLPIRLPRRATSITSASPSNSFAPYTKALHFRNPLHGMMEVLKKMKKQVPERERFPGYIYVYSRSNAPGFLKVGYSKDTKGRLNKWRKCGGSIKEVLRVWIPCAAVHHIEVLIHLVLGVYRMEETCWGCKPCSMRHQEWFEVDEKTVRAAVGLWHEFAELMPWDDAGRLAEPWRLAVENELKMVKERKKNTKDAWKPRLGKSLGLRKCDEPDMVERWLRNTMQQLRD